MTTKLIHEKFPKAPLDDVVTPSRLLDSCHQTFGRVLLNFQLFPSLFLLALLLASAGCQSLNPTKEQQLQSTAQLEPKHESNEGRMVTQAGSLLYYVLPFLSN